jgi:eukaryotic-like serine/threonine-protein kinase
MSPVSGRKPILPDPEEPGRGAERSRYELLVKVASGGMATVYVGRRRSGDGRFWAIKRAHAHLLERSESRKMFIEEARIASMIRHPNIVTVEDVEELTGELRLVMEYVEGGTLADLVGRDDPLPPALAVRIALDAAAGLHAAHGMTAPDGTPLGLVHRDVSPHNILVGTDGIARLSDFGIAKNAHSSMSTTTGALKGKLAYMSPEYIEGAKADTRHDVFALGVVVWEMLANRRLFRGANELETMKLVVAAEVPPLSRVAPDVARELDPVLAMALARRPADRFENAQALGAAIRTVADRVGLVASHADVGTHLSRVLATKLQKRRAELAALLVPSGAVDPKSSTAKMGGAAAPPASGKTLPLAGVGEPGSVTDRDEPPTFKDEQGTALQVAEEEPAAVAPRIEPAPPGQTLVIDSQAPTNRLGEGRSEAAVTLASQDPDARQMSLPIDTMRSRAPTSPPTPEPPPHISVIDASTEVESSVPEPAGVPKPSRALAWIVTAVVGLALGGGLTLLLFGEDPEAEQRASPVAEGATQAGALATSAPTVASSGIADSSGSPKPGASSGGNTGADAGAAVPLPGGKAHPVSGSPAASPPPAAPGPLPSPAPPPKPTGPSGAPVIKPNPYSGGAN